MPYNKGALVTIFIEHRSHQFIIIYTADKCSCAGVNGVTRQDAYLTKSCICMQVYKHISRPTEVAYRRMFGLLRSHIVHRLLRATADSIKDQLVGGQNISRDYSVPQAVRELSAWTCFCLCYAFIPLNPQEDLEVQIWKIWFEHLKTRALCHISKLYISLTRGRSWQRATMMKAQEGFRAGIHASRGKFVNKRLTKVVHIQKVSSRQGGLSCYVLPIHRCKGCWSITWDLDFVATDAVKQEPQKVFRQILSIVDTSIVLDKVFRIHLLLHLHETNIDKLAQNWTVYCQLAWLIECHLLTLLLSASYLSAGSGVSCLFSMRSKLHTLCLKKQLGPIWVTNWTGQDDSRPHR